MLYTIAVVLLILWVLGLVTSYTMGGFIHILLVVAIVMVLVEPHQRAARVVTLDQIPGGITPGSPSCAARPTCNGSGTVTDSIVTGGRGDTPNRLSTDERRVCRRK